jgi:hypothetical protein
MESFTFYVDAFCPLSGKLHTLVMLEYCYWWKGSWLLKKWSHHVCS